MIRRSLSVSSAVPFSLVVSALLLAGCAGTPASNVSSASTARTSGISGILHGGQQPITGANIQLYQVGTTGDGSAATPLISSTVTTSDGTGTMNANANAGNSYNTLPAGSFVITGDYTCAAGAYVYLVGIGGNAGDGDNPQSALMAALGSCSALQTNQPYIFMDELTTVASVAALAPYMSSYSTIGSGTGDVSSLQAAFNTVNEYVNTATGTVPGPGLPAGDYGSSIEIETLGDAISACINSAGGTAGDGTSCGKLFTYTTSGSSVPTETLGATLNIVTNPTQSSCSIFGLIPSTPPYQPTLTSCPSSWALPIGTLSVSIWGSSYLYTGQTAQYVATVTGTDSQSVTWQVNGVTGGNSTTGTITAGGLYTTPASVPSTPPVISAISSISSSATATQTITIATPPSQLATGDARTVVQPAYPAVCQQLFASITTTSGYDLSASDNLHFDTSAIQAALTACKSTNQAVELSASGSYNAFQIAPITLPAGVTLLIDPGVTVFASINPRDYDVSAGSCGVTGSSSTGCKPLILAHLATGSAIMGLGTINGRGGDTLQNTSPTTTWWGLSSTAQTNGNDQNNPILLEITNSNNFTLYQVSFVNAPIAHVVYNYGTGFTVWGVTTNTPYSARNTDSLDIGNSTNVTVTDSILSGGDDDVAIDGASGTTPSAYSIVNNHIYNGHGLSIGSITYDGVNNILFANNTFSNDPSDSNSTGMRIKSAANEGGIVNNITYQNICIQNNRYPLQVNPHYSSSSGTEYPQFTNIGFHNVNVLTAGKVEIEGYSATYPASVTLDNVNFVSLPATDVTPAPEYATITLGPGPVSSNLTSQLTGTGVTVVNNVSNSNAAISCPASIFGTAPANIP